MLIEVRIAQFFGQVGWINHADRGWDMRKKLVELRQTEGAQHDLDLLVSGGDIMAGRLAWQDRGVVGQRWQGRMVHISPDHTLTSTSLTARVSECGKHPCQAATTCQGRVSPACMGMTVP